MAGFEQIFWTTVDIGRQSRTAELPDNLVSVFLFHPDSQLVIAYYALLRGFREFPLICESIDGLGTAPQKLGSSLSRDGTQLLKLFPLTWDRYVILSAGRFRLTYVCYQTVCPGAGVLRFKRFLFEPKAKSPGRLPHIRYHPSDF